MLTILTEDSGDGYTFWDSVNRELLGDKAILDAPDAGQTLGCMTLLPRLKRKIDKGEIKTGNIVLIAIDSTETVQVMSGNKGIM